MRFRTDQSYRCSVCYMHREQCICEHAPKIQTSTKIIVVMHHQEKWKSTNTARLIPLALNNSELFVRGLPKNFPEEMLPVYARKTSMENVIVDGCGLSLYPDENAVELNDELLESIQKPITLLVPDGTWNQASRIVKREKLFSDTISVRLPPGAVSRSPFRRQYDRDYLSTYESIVEALFLIEKRKDLSHASQLKSKMDSFFDLMIQLTVQSSGRIPRPVGVNSGQTSSP